MEGFDNLSALQLDALREIMNIGAGNAATAFANMINHKITMTVPQANIVPFDKVHTLVSRPDVAVAGVLMQVMGQAPGTTLFMLPVKNALQLVHMLVGKEVAGEHADEISESAFTELANIMAHSYFNALSQFTGLTFLPTVPALGVDMAVALMDTAVVKLGEVGDDVLVLQTEFKQGETGIIGYFLFVPEPGALDAILSALGVKD
jgi:chemotaxis protein CheC